MKEEKKDITTYVCTLICDEKVVYQKEATVLSRFSLLEEHNSFLSLVEKYQATGELPGRAASLLKKFN